MGKIRLNKNILKKMQEGTYGLVSVKQGLLGDQYFDTGAEKYKEVWDFLLTHFDWTDKEELLGDKSLKINNCFCCDAHNNCKNAKLPNCFIKKD